ncbi:MAG TPA: DsrE/DsrF/DrsH-like family protein [Nitrososphaerales archaeon]|nr:DsrE/DsrF/DrsH-like family protein [Nitrososphaerales archaeon]
MATVTVQKERVPEREASTGKISIILSKGSLDMVYPAFMIGTTAAAMGNEVHLFFTFWGLNVLNKKKVGDLKVSPVGNPGMPMPNILGMLPGMTAMATRMMKGKIKETKTPTIPEMIQTCKELGVKIHACSTSMEFLGIGKEDLIPEVDDIIGASTFLQLSEGGQTLFI